MEPPRKNGYCYFCNEKIDRYNEQGHISTCGSVLEPCPNKCGSYVQRKMKRIHMTECANRTQLTQRSRPSGTLDRVPVRRTGPDAGYSATTGTIPPPQSQSQQVQTEIWRLGSTLNKLESNLKQVAIAVEAMRKEQTETRVSKAAWDSQRKLELDKLNLQYQMILEWKKQIMDVVEHSRHQLTENGAKCRASELHLQNRLVLLDQLMMDFNLLRQNVAEEQRFRQEAASMWRNELDGFKTFFGQENAMTGGLWNDHGKELKKLADGLNDAQGAIAELTAKHHVLVFDVKGHSKSVSELDDLIATQTKEFGELRKNVVQLRNDFLMLEQVADNGTVCSQITPGKFLWKITDYTAKLQQSKDNDLIIKSPPFYSHECGHKIRVEVFLNGIKKWKGRHLIATLRVLKGDFDNLLSWPCNIEGCITLRDQNVGYDIKDVKKFISAKRQIANEDSDEPQESSTQYIFISHATLAKHNYIKDDAFFLDVKVEVGYNSIHNGHTLV